MCTHKTPPRQIPTQREGMVRAPDRVSREIFFLYPHILRCGQLSDSALAIALLKQRPCVSSSIFQSFKSWVLGQKAGRETQKPNIQHKWELQHNYSWSNETNLLQLSSNSNKSNQHKTQQTAQTVCYRLTTDINQKSHLTKVTTTHLKQQQVSFPHGWFLNIDSNFNIP